MEVSLPEGTIANQIKLTLNSEPIDASFKNVGNKTVVLFKSQKLNQNDIISVNIEI